MKAVIIAGGKGTRLGLENIPKPMVLLGEKPLLEHQFELLKRYGIIDIFILSGYLSNVILDAYGDGAKLGLNISHITEPYPLGTAGSVRLLQHRIAERFLVLYGDIACNMDLEKLILFDEKHESLATIVVHPNDHPYDSDLVEVDDHDKIVAFHSKPHDEQSFYKNCVSAGVYILSPRIFDHIPSDKATDFGKDIFPSLVTHQNGLYAYRTTEYIKDVGTPQRLTAVQSDIMSNKLSRLHSSNERKAIFLDRDGVINVFVDNISSAQDFELLPDAAAAIRSINAMEYLAVVVTNQPMIAKGLLSKEELLRIHCKMESLLGRERAFLDAVYYCPHHPEKGFKGEVPELKIICQCRKPKIGLFLQARDDLHIDLENSWMIGDSTIDIQAGKNAGCKTALIRSDRCQQRNGADIVATNLFSAVERIRNSIL